MSPHTETIHVFKTNIETEADAQAIGNVLDKHMHISKWSVDLNDVDRVLRVVTPSLLHTDIITLINKHGYTCAELE